MYVEMVSDFFYDIYLINTIYIYPGYGWFIFERKTFFNRSCFLLLKLPFIIVNDRNPYPASLLLPYVNRSPWRKTNLF